MLFQRSLTVFFFCAALIASVFVGAEAQAAEQDSHLTVAVFPFKVLNKDPRAMHLGEGASEHIITHLVQSGAIEVVEESQLDKAVKQIAKGQSGMFEEKSAIELGRLVNAKYIVIGTVQLFGYEASLNARLLDVSTAKLVLATSVQGKWSAIFDLYEQLAKKVTQALATHLDQLHPKIAQNTAQATSLTAVPQPAKPSAEELMAKGQKLDPATGGKDPKAAIKLYRQAVLSDPGDPQARRLLAGRLIAIKRFDEARYNLNKSLATEPKNAWAQSQMGYCLHKLDDEKTAILHYQKALGIAPDDTQTRAWLAASLLSLGKNLEAQTEFKKVLSSDPNNDLARRGLRVAEQRIQSASR